MRGPRHLKLIRGRGLSTVGIELHLLLSDYAGLLSRRIDNAWHVR